MKLDSFASAEYHCAHVLRRVLVPVVRTMHRGKSGVAVVDSVDASLFSQPVELPDRRSRRISPKCQIPTPAKRMGGGTASLVVTSSHDGRTPLAVILVHAPLVTSVSAEEDPCSEVRGV